MPSPESFTGFPWGTLTYETTDSDIYTMLAKAARLLTSEPSLLHPPTLAEHYALYTRFDVAQPDGSNAELTAIVPMDKASYDEFWHFTPPEKPVVQPRDQPVASPLDLFAPKQPEPEYEPDDFFDSYFENKRLFHDQRMAVVRRVAGSIATDPQIDRYINSFGTFTNPRGASKKGQNLDATDISYVVYTGERPMKETLLYHAAGSTSTKGDVDSYRHGHVSPFTGETASTERDKDEWAALIRADTQRVADGIASVADFYDSIYGERGLEYKPNRGSRILGTIATRDFFEGYISLAPVGITLLAANHLRPLDDEDYGCGQPFINSPDYWINNIYPSSKLYFAVRSDIETRPTQVEFRNTYDVTSPETWSRMIAYGYPEGIPGLLSKCLALSGSYSINPKLLIDGELPNYISQYAKVQVGEAGLAHVRAGGVFAEKPHAFSHTDFYRIFEQIASYTQ